MEEYKQFDLLATNQELVIRKDGFVFEPQESADGDGKLPKDWLDGGEMLPTGALCTFIRLGDEDSSYAIVCRDTMGRGLAIPLRFLKLISSIDDAVDAVDEEKESDA